MKPESTTPIPLNASDASVAAESAYQLGVENKPQELRTHDGAAFLILPTGLRAASLDHLAPTPRRFSAAVSLFSAGDLARYVMEQTCTKKDLELLPESAAGRQLHHPVVFCDRSSTSIIAYLDYHSPHEPRWLDHTAKVTYKPSHQFARWKEKNGKRMKQEEFALFLDEVRKDIANPSAALVVDFAEKMEFFSNVAFKSSVKTSSGETNLVFADEKKGDIGTPVIEEFTLAIPFWQAGEPIAIRARLFHRAVDTKDSAGVPTGAKHVVFWFELRHLEEIADTLFAEEVASLRKDLDGIATIYLGTPPDAPKAQTISPTIQA